jgi:hypothetical protein
MKKKVLLVDDSKTSLLIGASLDGSVRLRVL